MEVFQSQSLLPVIIGIGSLIVALQRIGKFAREWAKKQDAVDHIINSELKANGGTSLKDHATYMREHLEILEDKIDSNQKTNAKNHKRMAKDLKKLGMDLRSLSDRVIHIEDDITHMDKDVTSLKDGFEEAKRDNSSQHRKLFDKTDKHSADISRMEGKVERPL